jgi:hypothetical protein
MTDTKRAKPSIEKLELSKETVQDLTASEAEAAAGGQCGSHHQCPPPKWSQDKPQLCKVSNLDPCPQTGDKCPKNF